LKKQLRRHLVVPLAALALVATACGDDSSSESSDTTSGTEETTEESSDTTAEETTESTAEGTEDTVEVTQGEDVTIAVITHGDGGVFWSVAQAGAEQAGEDLGIDVIYTGANNDGAAQAQAIDQAVADGVDGLAVSLADPGALESSVTAAVDAGIPVITMNSGSDLFRDLGAITHVGQDEFVAGQGAGEQFADAGVTKLLCVMQEQANVGLEARCDGAEDTLGGTVERITTSGDADPTTSQAEIKAALEADDSIDGVFATGPIGAVLANNAVDELGRDLTIGAVDLSTELLDAIEAGDIAFTIDQQQYLQGYLSVVFLYLNITNANTVGGGAPVFTGPGFVTTDNVSSVKELVAGGTR
jgi:simple sugar transport system substrate-binding protein